MCEANLKLFLSEVCVDYALLVYKAEESNNFVAKIQCKFPISHSPQEHCKSFVQQFSTFSHTNWIVKRCPSVKRLEFRKKYGCQRSSFNKKNPALKGTSRNLDCNASIDFKYKKINRNTIKNDNLLKRGLNVVIEINFSHSHKVDVASAYKYLRCDNSIRETYNEYFEAGMTPTVAKHYHEVNLSQLDERGSQNIANAQKNPTYRSVRHFYDTWRKTNSRGLSEPDVLSVLKGRIPILSEKGVSVVIDEDPMIVVVITPIMKRLFQNGFSDEVVYMESSGSCDQTCTRVTLVFCATKVGGFPLACVLHTADNTLAFTALRDALEKDTDKRFQPSVIMTDDSYAERNALKSVFPQSRLLLCHFHIGQAVWRWLCLLKHNLEKESRKRVMKAFQAVLYLEDEEEAIRNYTHLTSVCSETKNLSLTEYMGNLWSRRHEWCLCYRNDLLTRDNSANNYIESSIRVFKDVVLQRTKAFNSCALVKFITENLETYHQLRLLEFAHSGHSKDIVYMKYLEKAEKITEFYRVNDDEYKVQSECDNKEYTVLTDIACCECPQGKCGKFCKHLCLLESTLNILFKTSPRINSKDRREMALLSLGDVPPDIEVNNHGTSANEPKTGENTGNEVTILPPQSPEILSITPSENSCEKQDKIRLEVDKLRKHFERLSDILETDSSLSNRMLVKRLNKTCNKIQNIEQARCFAMKRVKFCALKKICVQPTAIGRGRNSIRLQSARKAPTSTHNLSKYVHVNENRHDEHTIGSYPVSDTYPSIPITSIPQEIRSQYETNIEMKESPSVSSLISSPPLPQTQRQYSFADDSQSMSLQNYTCAEEDHEIFGAFIASELRCLGNNYALIRSVKRKIQLTILEAYETYDAQNCRQAWTQTEDVSLQHPYPPPAPYEPKIKIERTDDDDHNGIQSTGAF